MRTNSRSAVTQPVLLRDESGGVVTLNVEPPSAVQRALEGRARRTAGGARCDCHGCECAGGRDCRRRQGVLRRARPEGDARPPVEEVPAIAVRAVQPRDDDAHGHAAAGDCAGARLRYGGGLPAGGDVRSSGRFRRCALRCVGHQRRAVLLNAFGGAGAERGPQAGDGDAADGRFHRRANGARARAGEPGCARTSARRRGQEPDRCDRRAQWRSSPASRCSTGSWS